MSSSDQNVAAAETQVSGWKRLPVETARRFAGWANAHRLIAGLIIGGFISLIVLPIVVSWVISTDSQKKQATDLVTIDQALQALDRGELPEARNLAKQLQSQGTLTVEELGGPAFIFGAAAAREAEEAPAKDRAKLHLLSVRYLEEANNRGFPDDRRAEGLYLLGKSMYASGQYSTCRPFLFSALRISRKYNAEIHSLLANSYLNDTRPRLEPALEQNGLLLAEKKLSDAQRQSGLIQRARILLQLGKIDDCNKVLDQISTDVNNPAVAIERGKVLMYEARELLEKTSDSKKLLTPRAREKFQAAVKTFQPALSKDSNDVISTRQTMYLTAVCNFELDDKKTAADQFARTFNLYPDTPEGIAAGCQAAELFRGMRRELDCLNEYRRTLNNISDPSDYVNPWLPLDQLKSQLLATYQFFLSEQNYEIAMQFTQLMQRLFPNDQVLLLRAETHNLWGQNLLSQADKGPRNKCETMNRTGREQFRRAGVCYATLANLLPANKSYTDQVWNSAMAFMQGQDFNNAAKMLQVYMKNEVQSRHPQALAYLGEAFLTQNKLDKALAMLNECIDLYPRDIASCKARLLAARVYEEQGEWSKAESLLTNNLISEYLTPESKEWRDTLFMLGELLHDKGNLPEAVRRLEEAAKRYPDLSETIQARYLTADCYYKMAVAAEEKLNKSLTGNSRDIQTKQIQELFAKSLEQFKLVQDMLTKERNSAEITAAQRAIMRNCTFAIGDVYFARGDYEAAIKAYSTALNRYQNYPEVLNAYVQIANAYRKLNKPQEAKDALQQAKFTLNRMKADVAFEKTTNYNRQQWAERLDSLMSL